MTAPRCAPLPCTTTNRTPPRLPRPPQVLNPSASGASPVPAPLVFPTTPSSLPSAPHSLEAELQGLSPLDAQKCLTGRIKSARTLHDFSQVVAAGGRLVDSICLVAILAGLPRAVQRATLPVATPGGPGASRAQLSTQDAAELSSLVSSLESLVRIRLREFDSNGLVTVAVGFAKLSTHVAVGPAVFRTLLSAVEPRLGGLATKALANLLWAVGTAGVQPCGSWLSGYYGAVERQLEAFSGGDLANLMWGLAKFDLMPEVGQGACRVGGRGRGRRAGGREEDGWELEGAGRARCGARGVMEQAGIRRVWGVVVMRVQAVPKSSARARTGLSTQRRYRVL